MAGLTQRLWAHGSVRFGSVVLLGVLVLSLLAAHQGRRRSPAAPTATL